MERFRAPMSQARWDDVGSPGGPTNESPTTPTTSHHTGQGNGAPISSDTPASGFSLPPFSGSFPSPADTRLRLPPLSPPPSTWPSVAPFEPLATGHPPPAPWPAPAAPAGRDVWTCVKCGDFHSASRAAAAAHSLRCSEHCLWRCRMCSAMLDTFEDGEQHVYRHWEQMRRSASAPRD